MSVSRRTFVRGSAWATPAIIATSTIPAYASSVTTTCPSFVGFSTDHTSDGGLSLLPYDDDAFVTFTADSMPPDAILDVYALELDLASVDTSLWQVVSTTPEHTELKYIGFANKAVSSRFKFVNLPAPEDYYIQFTNEQKTGYRPSSQWSDVCTAYGQPVGDTLCINGRDAKDSALDIYQALPITPKVQLRSEECGINKEKSLYIDYTKSTSALDFKVEDLSVTADAITFTYTGSLYGLIVYTDAEDATPMLSSPEPFVATMDYTGYMGQSFSKEVVTKRTFTIPLSGERVPAVQIGRVITLPFPDFETLEVDYDASYKYAVGDGPDAFGWEDVPLQP